jgi:hypothetical protein
VRDSLIGILLGTAVGDALGLPAESLRPGRRRRLFPGQWRHRFLFLARRSATEPTLFGSRPGTWISSTGSSILNRPARSAPSAECPSTIMTDEKYGIFPFSVHGVNAPPPAVPRGPRACQHGSETVSVGVRVEHNALVGRCRPILRWTWLHLRSESKPPPP